MPSESDRTGAHIGRRRFLGATAVGLAAWTFGPRLAAAQQSYRVAIGRNTDAYAATRRAVEASGEWPAARIAGATVVIKPNLVNSKPSATGVTTDVQVIRALVDLALKTAARVLIVEYDPSNNKYAACGYDLFRGYDPAGRVELIDLTPQPMALKPVPDGMAYLLLSMPRLLFEPDVVYISAAKLKTHLDAMVTLSMKNSFGLPPIAPYQNSAIPGRFAMHSRSVNQTIVDLNFVRPIDFAVVDGIWGLEGDGPLSGNPVRMNTVVAGRNALAVDRVCVDAMGLPLHGVQHLEYAAAKGLGPADASEIEVVGDALARRSFVPPVIPPIIYQPRADPVAFTPSAGQRARLVFQAGAACLTRVEIVRTSETSPEVELVRIVRNWARSSAEVNAVDWDGRDNRGATVPPGFYSIRVGAKYSADGRLAYATGSIWIKGR